MRRGIILRYHNHRIAVRDLRQGSVAIGQQRALSCGVFACDLSRDDEDVECADIENDNVEGGGVCREQHNRLEEKQISFRSGQYPSNDMAH